MEKPTLSRRTILWPFHPEQSTGSRSSVTEPLKCWYSSLHWTPTRQTTPTTWRVHVQRRSKTESSLRSSGYGLKSRREIRKTKCVARIRISEYLRRTVEQPTPTMRNFGSALICMVLSRVIGLALGAKYAWRPVTGSSLNLVEKRTIWQKIAGNQY